MSIRHGAGPRVAERMSKADRHVYWTLQRMVDQVRLGLLLCSAGDQDRHLCLWEQGWHACTAVSFHALSKPSASCHIEKVKAATREHVQKLRPSAHDLTDARAEQQGPVQVVKDHEKEERKAGRQPAKAADKQAGAADKAKAAQAPAKTQHQSLQHLLKPSDQARYACSWLVPIIV